MRTAPLSQKQIAAAERTLNVGTWAITAGAVLFSILTVTPLVQRVTPDGWDWTAPILPLVVDAAVVIVIRLDSAVSRLGGSGGPWPVVLRWLTGLFTVGLNVGDSVWKDDPAGVAVHAVAPLLLIVTAEAGLAYRRAIAKALDRIAREQEEEAEQKRVHAARERAEREQQTREREQREREEREQREAAEERREREAREHAAQMEQQEREDRARQQDAEERREREARDHAAKLEQQRRDHEAQILREQREAEIAQRREETEREERQQERARQERAAREQQEQAARERREREQHERAERERVEREQQEQQARERAVAAARERRDRQAMNTGRASVNAAESTRRPSSVNAPVNALSADARLSKDDARNLILNTPGASVRDLADKTGWSIGWVSQVRNQGHDEESAAAYLP